MLDPETLVRFGRLFKGREDAWGTGKGAVLRGHLRETHYASHLAGIGPGLGIFPLLDDGTVHFAAVDLDEPDIDAAQQFQELLPSPTWIERSRSGNYHIWACFAEPIEAWIPRGMMKSVAAAIGKPRVEIFPKQDRLREGMVGNYINLPLFGKERPILGMLPEDFIYGDVTTDPRRWQLRAERLGLRPAEARSSGREFGMRPALHECAVYILHGIATGERPLVEGHRHIVLFNLAKMLLDYEGFSNEEAWEHFYGAGDTSGLSRQELNRIFNNAQRGRYTSTGCDDPVMAPYVDPTCPIARQT